VIFHVKVPSQNADYKNCERPSEPKTSQAKQHSWHAANFLPSLDLILHVVHRRQQVTGQEEKTSQANDRCDWTSNTENSWPSKHRQQCNY